ncbi:MAG TPA: thiol:disulfide interchange protein DsbA/DsbL [Casimicrobiaceae bacterium]|nr:thiol:disulfide interchange protein DsbA/DsbL [Casimicrobiaceae bacterium]
MRRWITCALSAMALLALSNAGAADLVEGRDYTRLKGPQPTDKKIEVIEFFSYGCPHCNDLEPYVQAWLKKVPPDVQFRRVPVEFQDRWASLAKVYFTLEAMGEDVRLSPEVFKAIHGSGLPLYQDKAFFDWAASKGLDRAKVADVYNSFGVDSKMKRARAAVQEYRIDSVPTLLVDGKFMTSSSRLAGGHAAVPLALDELVAKARAERPKT